MGSDSTSNLTDKGYQREHLPSPPNMDLVPDSYEVPDFVQKGKRTKEQRATYLIPGSNVWLKYLLYANAGSSILPYRDIKVTPPVQPDTTEVIISRNIKNLKAPQLTQKMRLQNEFDALIA
ncbi:hypothetical protein C1646_770661 [Rhizophagus diaphanus]|nr:hypothetical protein C1646_770661 [Rhizophagus diaphanus] [Rhizophagus sp. MUCL 43196]